MIKHLRSPVYKYESVEWIELKITVGLVQKYCNYIFAFYSMRTFFLLFFSLSWAIFSYSGHATAICLWHSLGISLAGGLRARQAFPMLYPSVCI